MEKVDPVLFFCVVWLRTDSVMVLERSFDLNVPQYMLLRDTRGNNARSRIKKNC